MPFGKYKGRVIADLPVKVFLQEILGNLLAPTQTIDHNEFKPLLMKLRN
jgi:uncharacterized protein (DUF3820 family)